MLPGGRIHLVLAALLLGSSCGSDRGDTSYDTSVSNPAYGSDHPKLAFDEGHRERHLSRETYRPFAELARHDGYAIERIDDPITESELDGVRVLVIACAQGEGETGEAAAFTPSECTAIERWVDSGGGLLLVADAFPFGSAADSLARKFGIEIAKGMTADAIQYDREWKDDTQLDFNRENHLLGVHPVTEGRTQEERVGRVVTYTGTSVRGPSGSAVFLRHGSTAVMRAAKPSIEQTSKGPRLHVEYGEEKPAEGWGQGVALVHGRGRVVVLGESAVLTAQLDGARKYGMNAKGNDDRKLALNTLHWLSGLLP